MCALQAGSMASVTGTRYGERPSLVYAPLRLPSFSPFFRPSAKAASYQIHNASRICDTRQ